MNIAVVLFNDFETLDVFGPVEIFGRLIDYNIKFYSLNGGIIHNKDGISIQTQKLNIINEKIEIFFIPGGIGTRKEVKNNLLIEKIRQLSINSSFVLTVCTGSALLAQTGLLDGKKATSNKRSFSWVKNNGINVKWDQKARWVVDGKYYTSSEISAGIDMTLGFISDQHGRQIAEKIAFEIEYHWIQDKDTDSFQATFIIGET